MLPQATGTSISMHTPVDVCSHMQAQILAVEIHYVNNIAFIIILSQKMILKEGRGEML